MTEPQMILMPEKADQEMTQAVEDYFASRVKYKDGKNLDAMHADCWMALMAYCAMVDVVKKRAATEKRKA